MAQTNLYLFNHLPTYTRITKPLNTIIGIAIFCGVVFPSQVLAQNASVIVSIVESQVHSKSTPLIESLILSPR